MQIGNVPILQLRKLSEKSTAKVKKIEKAVKSPSKLRCNSEALNLFSTTMHYLYPFLLRIDSTVLFYCKDKKASFFPISALL